MRMLLRVMLVAAIVTGIVGVNSLVAADASVDIKTVMEKAHKSGLLKKVTSGKASDAEKKELCELYVALAANKPPRGDVASWKSKTEAIVAACKKVAGGSNDKADLAALKKA
ncbi:MAG: hypothetical protein NZ700_03735, partial [Gemmataceae bacterium]|nr:hypothetical protein [Gemmataceae bacterium]